MRVADWKLGTKIGICVAVSVALLLSVNLYFLAKYNKQEQYSALIDRARTAVMQAESSREYIAGLRSHAMFNDEQMIAELLTRLTGDRDKLKAVRETSFYRSIPIMAALKIGGEKASQSGFRFRAPKIQARNKENEPDAVELKMLKEMEAGNLPELAFEDKASNIMRYMRPIKLTKDCMLCHGEVSDSRNKDGLDLLGVKMEGWRVGEQHGAFELIADLAPIQRKVATQVASAALLTIALTVLCIGLIIFALRAMIVRPATSILGMLTDIAQGGGDLTRRLDCRSQDEIGAISCMFNLFVSKLQGIIGKVAGNTTQLASAAVELHANAGQMATGIEEVAAQAATVATAGEEMAATAADIALNCHRAAEEGGRANDAAIAGAAVVEKAVAAMQLIADRVRESAATVTNLGTRSEEIGEIISTIEEIADQTNLLALNAAIEAARAGDQGRGFAVVADEVRALAERTSRATREIGSMIRAIQQDTRQAVLAMEEGVAQVAQGTLETGRSGEALKDVVTEIAAVTEQLQQIATAAEQQTATTTDISSNIAQMTWIVQETAKGAQASAQAANELAQLAENLQREVDYFKLS
jgi:methyl-accepting chemotaxis protein